MSKLTIMRGVPGSGKSTKVDAMRADEPDLVVVSRDNLRNAFFNRERGVDEDFITTVEHQAIRDALALDKHVVSDNTNIQFKYVSALIKIAYEFDAEVEIVELVEDLATCLDRNIYRALEGGRDVPEDVIKRMFSQYKPFKYEPLPTFEPYVPDVLLPEAVLFDIDGTLATKGDRGYYEWDKVNVDHAVESLVNVANFLFEGGCHVIIFSGRDGSSEQQTREWLIANSVCFDELHMRAAGDMRPDTIVKMEMFDAYIRNNYNCLGVFDDRPSVVRGAWLKHDIPCFHVTPFAKDF